MQETSCILLVATIRQVGGYGIAVMKRYSYACAALLACQQAAANFFLGQDQAASVFKPLAISYAEP